jgi:hypothetical protein
MPFEFYNQVKAIVMVAGVTLLLALGLVVISLWRWL